MERILLVEDDSAIYQPLTSFLRGEGFAVRQASGQREALALLETEEFDLVLLDVGLRDGNGFSVCSAVKQRGGTAVIFLSASGDEYSVVTGLDLGADDYIAKPFRPRELVSRIRSVLRSEVRKMTLRLREQSAQLEKEKLQLADAMADISHQMRTPLTAVNLLLTSLAGHVDEESRGDVRALRRQVARMDWLVESLLKLAKLDAGTARFCPETIPLSALLARAAEPFAIGMELRGQQLQVEASGNVRCDPAWTAEALGNILKNCSEHMQEGTITVRAEENAVASVVVIRDTGGGIAPQDLPHLFERYYKGENAPEQSVGIGLALSRSIAAAQNGTLTAANVPGGAEFTMKLYKGIV